MNQRLFSDFCKFATAQIRIGDIDPVYPILKTYYNMRGMAGERALWFTFLYVLWYNVGVAERLYNQYNYPATIRRDKLEGLPTGIERRGFRGNTNAAVAVDYLVSQIGNLAPWVAGIVSWSDNEVNWRMARVEFEKIPYCGPWASFKWADLLKNVHGYPLTSPDIGVGGGGKNAGPVPGLSLILEESWERCAEDISLQREFYVSCRLWGVPFNGMEEMETALCDFNSLYKGRYYVGHDIDDLMPKMSGASRTMWEARQESFSPRYLGEQGGWEGVRAELKPVYRDTGVVLV